MKFFGFSKKMWIAGAVAFYMSFLCGPASLDAFSVLDASSLQLKILKNQADHLVLADRFEEAIQVYRDVLAQKPDYANCFYNMAICYNKLGEFEKSFEALEGFIRYRPQDCETYYNMGILKIYLGDNQQAKLFLSKAKQCPSFGSGPLCTSIEAALLYLEEMDGPGDQNSQTSRGWQEIQAHLLEVYGEPQS